MEADISSVHDHVIQTWLALRKLKPQMSDEQLAKDIFFSVTDEHWPEGVPPGSTAIEVCAAINQHFGYPELTEQDIKSLTVRTVLNLREVARMQKFLKIHAALKALAVLLALAATLLIGINWILIGLVSSMLLAGGVSRTASSMRHNGQVSPSVDRFWIMAHILLLLGALAMSTWLLVASII